MITTYKHYMTMNRSKLLSEQNDNNEKYILQLTILELLMLLFYSKVHFKNELVFYSLTDKSNSAKVFLPSIENNNKTVIIYLTEIPDSLQPPQNDQENDTGKEDKMHPNVPINDRELSLTMLKPYIKRIEVAKMFISQVNSDDEIGIFAIQNFFKGLIGKLNQNQLDEIRNATTREQLIDIISDILTKKQSGYIINFV